MPARRGGAARVCALVAVPSAAKAVLDTLLALPGAQGKKGRQCAGIELATGLGYGAQCRLCLMRCWRAPDGQCGEAALGLTLPCTTFASRTGLVVVRSLGTLERQPWDSMHGQHVTLRTYCRNTPGIRCL